MKKSSSTHTNQARFRCWSRKAYAVFASLGKAVSIGCLHRNVMDAALAKQSSQGVCWELRYTEEMTDHREEEEKELPIPELGCLFVWSVQIVESVAGAYTYPVTVHYII